ncbi:MAG: YfiR family protein [Cycloclasticus sp.]
MATFSDGTGCTRGLAALLITLFISSAPAIEFSADEVKAVYLFNFTSFISWPDDTFSDELEPFTYCSMGSKSAVIEPLGEILLGEKVGERAVQYKTISSLSKLKSCQILYIDQQQKVDVVEILAAIADASVLTVSDIDGFAEQGGGVEFSAKAGRIKLLINILSIKKSRLNISSKLLRIAELINSPNEGNERW